MTFLCDMWRFSAEEYLSFLGRKGIKCLGIHITYRNRMSIFVDEAHYLDLALNDNQFIEDEKQILKLIERCEVLVNKFMELAAKNPHVEEQLDDQLEQYDEE